MQSYTKLLFHVVFGTRDRVELLTPAMRPRLIAYIGGTIAKTSGVLLCGQAMPEHVHLFISLNATANIAGAVRDMKANSSRWLKETFPALGRSFAWQSGYGAFSVSHSLREAVRKYIETQERHHEKRSFRDEYLGFLDRHGIEYNPRTVFA
ncbi:MAG: IS200/IS605 family transposase [Phycisphaerales bacterium]